MLKKQPSANSDYNIQKRLLQLFILTLFVSFICSQIGRGSFLISINYSLHDIVWGLANLIFLTPAILLFYFIFRFKHLKSKGNLPVKTKRFLPMFFMWTTVVAIYSLSYYQLHDFTAEGYMSIDHKMQEENHYYLWIDDTKMVTSQENYQLVKVDEEYRIRYSGNSLKPGQGKLVSVSTPQ